MPLLGLKKVQYELEVGILKRVNNNVKGVYLSGLGNIMAGTPVGLTQGEIPVNSISTSGLTMNNWFLSVGSPSGATTTSKSSVGASSLRQIAKLPSVVLGKRIFYTNNRPNITTLEYGGFPSPVKKGSRLRGKKKFQILSINGFSGQANGGWVRVALIAMGNKIRSL